MSDVGQTFTLAKQHGLLLNNLYQIDDATFRANWRRDDKDKYFSQVISGWGAAAVLAESLAIAIKLAPPLKDEKRTIARQETVAPAESDEDLFA